MSQQQRQAPAEPPREPGDYPLPSYAAYVWFDGNEIFLQLPAQAGEEGHTVRLPLRDVSWGAMLEILKARYKALGSRRERTLGNKAAPVQYDVEALLRAMGRTSARNDDGSLKVPKVQSHKTSLRDLGLD